MNEVLRTGGSVRVRVLVIVSLAGATPASGETWRITPSLTVAETLTDNVALAPDHLKRSDLITQVAPGIRIDGTGARLKLNLAYQRNHIIYANTSSQNHAQNYLSALGTLEAVQNWLFIDASASIAQEAISAFGAQPTSTNDANVNANRTETRTYQVSPYIRGRIGDTSQYLLRYRWTTTTSQSNQLGDSGFEELVGNIGGTTGLATLGWAVDGAHQRTRYDAARDAETSRVRASLTYQYDPQLQFIGSSGYETNNYSLTDNDAVTYGAGFEWAPTQRTQVSAFKEKRPFGNSHTYSVRHRTPLTAWRLTDRKDVTTSPNQLALVRAGTASELLFDALTSRIPDPIARRAEVDRLLRLTGTPDDLVLPGAIVTTSVYVQRAQEVSVAILGASNTVTLAASFIETQAITAGAGLSDDFSRSPGIEQRGITADWAHRVSGLSSLNVLASRVQSRSTTVDTLQSTQTSLRVLLTRQLGPKTSASIGARAVRFDDGATSAADYSEKALTATLAVTF